MSFDAIILTLVTLEAVPQRTPVSGSEQTTMDAGYGQEIYTFQAHISVHCTVQ